MKSGTLRHGHKRRHIERVGKKPRILVTILDGPPPRVPIGPDDLGVIREPQPTIGKPAKGVAALWSDALSRLISRK